MLTHIWPGNLRELRNAVERAVILGPREHTRARRPRIADRIDPIADGSLQARAARRSHLARAARAGAHCSRRRASPLARSRGAHPRYRRHDAAAETQTIWIGVIALMIPGRLGLRFVVAAGLLVLTTVTASVWTFLALTRLSGVVTDTVRAERVSHGRDLTARRRARTRGRCGPVDSCRRRARHAGAGA